MCPYLVWSRSLRVSCAVSISALASRALVRIMGSLTGQCTRAPILGQIWAQCLLRALGIIHILYRPLFPSSLSMLLCKSFVFSVSLFYETFATV